MLIGFASAIPSADGTSDADILREAACDRVYSAEHGVLVFEQLMDYLRPGDVAVVTSLAHIGSDIEAIVSTVSRLHEAKIGLHVVGSEVVPGTPVGDSFPQACAILMQHQVQWAQLNTPPNSKARARGRPPVLSAETKIRIEQMLRARRLSVGEIARVLDISPATIYRYFPGGARSSESRSGRGSGRQAAPPVSPRKR